MLHENLVISNVIFARQAIFSTLYIGKSSGKQDHYHHRHSDERWSELIITCSFIDITNFTCVLILYGLSCKKNLMDFVTKVSWISPGTHTHTHPFNGPVSRTIRVSCCQKVKPIWILLKKETVSGSDIIWAVCKSAPFSRQIATPTPTTQFITGRMAFLSPNQQHQSTDFSWKSSGNWLGWICRHRGKVLLVELS